MPVFLSYIFLLGSALLLAGIGIIISFLGEKACLSKQCKGQAIFIHRGMNYHLEPCDDFYNFVCTNFPMFGTSITDDIERYQIKHLVDYLEVPASWEDDERIEHIAKTLYQNCLNETQLKTEGIEPLNRVIRRIGGIPFIDPRWDYEKKVEFTIVNNDLKQFFNGFNSVFVNNRIISMNTYPSEHPKNESDKEKKAKLYHSYSIPPHLYYEVPPDPEKYMKYCIEFNKLYSTILNTNKTITDQDKREIKAAVIFKLKLLRIMDKTRNCTEQPFKFVNKGNDIMIGKQDNRVKIELYIRRKAQPGTINAQYVVLTPQFEKYVEELNKLLDVTPDRVLANYMGIEALIQVTPFLPIQFREIYNTYLKSEKDKNNKLLSDRELLCAKLVKDAMTTALTVQYLKEHPDPPKEIPVLNSLVMELMKEVKAILKHIKWASSKDRLHMLRLVNSLKIVSPLPKNILEKMQERVPFERFYMTMCMNEDSTLETYLAVKGVKMQKNMQLLNLKDETGQEIHHTVFHDNYDIFDTTIYYQEDSNSIVVPTGYLTYPSLDALWPKYLSYGGLAVWIARTIIKTIGYNNVLHPELRGGEPVIQTWWEQKTISGYENKRKCALHEYNKYLKKFKVQSNDANCLEDTLYDAFALQASYSAYKENVRMRFFVEPRIPFMTRYTVDQIFFIKYASSFCQYEGPGFKLYRNESDSAIVSSNFTVLYSLRNFPKFREVFGCDKSEKMNKEKPCDIWTYDTQSE